MAMPDDKKDQINSKDTSIHLESSVLISDNESISVEGLSINNEHFDVSNNVDNTIQIMDRLSEIEEFNNLDQSTSSESSESSESSNIEQIIKPIQRQRSLDANIQLGVFPLGKKTHLPQGKIITEDLVNGDQILVQIIDKNILSAQFGEEYLHTKSIGCYQMEQLIITQKRKLLILDYMLCTFMIQVFQNLVELYGQLLWKLIQNQLLLFMSTRWMLEKTKQFMSIKKV